MSSLDLTSRQLRHAACCVRAANTVIVPDPGLPPVIQGIESELDAAMVKHRSALQPTSGHYAVVQVTRSFDTRTRGGLFIDKIGVILIESHEAKAYGIKTRLVDHMTGTAAIHVVGSTMRAAWKECEGLLLQGTGECKTCGIIIEAKDGHFRCEICELRLSLGTTVTVECCICCEQRYNMYSLRCGHQLCYQCAKLMQEIENRVYAIFERRDVKVIVRIPQP